MSRQETCTRGHPDGGDNPCAPLCPLPPCALASLFSGPEEIIFSFLENTGCLSLGSPACWRTEGHEPAPPYLHALGSVRLEHTSELPSALPATGWLGAPAWQAAAIATRAQSQPSPGQRRALHLLSRGRTHRGRQLGPGAPTRLPGAPSKWTGLVRGLWVPKGQLLRNSAQ